MAEHKKPDEELPEALIAALQEQRSSTRILTSSVDRRIAELSAAHFETTTRRSLRPAWVAIAASLLVATVAMQFYSATDTPTDIVLADVDGSGQIDIADVFAIARSSSSVSQAELDALAMQVVAIRDDGSST